MNIGLFAAAEVGCEIVKFFKENTEGLSCLILDSKDTFNAKILSNSNAQEVLCSDFLDKESAVDKLRQMQLDLIILAWWPYM